MTAFLGNNLGIKYFLFLFIFLFYPYCQAEENNQTFLSLSDYLDKEKIEKATQSLEKISGSSASKLIIEINSNGGDLVEVLNFAKRIYELKLLNKFETIVYLNGNVLGPAAIIPFIADQLYSSFFISWGDIPLGNETVLPANILRAQVRSLINPQAPFSKLLYLFADAMSDPSFQVVETSEGWKILYSKDLETIKNNVSYINAAGQTLVVNQSQLEHLGIVKKFLRQEEFYKQFSISKESDKKIDDLQRHDTFEEKLGKHIHFKDNETNNIGYFYIGNHDSMISESTWLYIKQGLEYYKKKRPIFIILELDTPGGEVVAAQKISDALKEMDVQEDIPVVTFINNWAISAGAMLAYSTRFITTVKDGSMGAAEPIIAGEQGKMETASEKINSALRSDFASRAQFFDRNSSIAEAMVDKDTILVKRHGKIIKLSSESDIKKTGPDPDIIISNKGKLVTLGSIEMLDYGVADYILQPLKRPLVTKEEKSKGKWSFEKSELTQIPFFKQIPNAEVDAYVMDWKTSFFVFLATPLVSSLLLMGLFIGTYIELNHPGLGLPGFIAGTCLFLIILSYFSLDIAGWLELIILLTGLALFLTELFVLPTFGFLGILGIILFLIGLVTILVPELKLIKFDYQAHDFNTAGYYALEKLAWFAGSFILSLGIIALLARFVLPTFSGFDRFTLKGNEQDASKGFTSGFDPSAPKVGEEGIVVATLRPAGKIMINDRIIDAISPGSFIDQGEKIKVVEVEGSTIKVDRL